jgi:mono/diheme cytochrome c family protein
VWLALVLAGAANAGANDSSADNNSAARKLYLGKCARCHKLYDPARYSEKQWQVWMEKMSRKARLQPDQTGLVARYIEESLRAPKREAELKSTAAR